MFVTERLKEVFDTRTLILMYLDTQRTSSGSPDSRGIPDIAECCLTDPATVRRIVRGDGKRYPYENSLVGRRLVIEVKKSGNVEYMITDRGHAEIGYIKTEIAKAVGELA